jgi:hypothetical protein
MRGLERSGLGLNASADRELVCDVCKLLLEHAWAIIEEWAESNHPDSWRATRLPQRMGAAPSAR